MKKSSCLLQVLVDGFQHEQPDYWWVQRARRLAWLRLPTRCCTCCCTDQRLLLLPLAAMHLLPPAPPRRLNFGNPWELERLNIAYPISFYGHVSGAPRRPGPGGTCRLLA